MTSTQNLGLIQPGFGKRYLYRGHKKHVCCTTTSTPKLGIMQPILVTATLTLNTQKVCKMHYDIYTKPGYYATRIWQQLALHNAHKTCGGHYEIYATPGPYATSIW